MAFLDIFSDTGERAVRHRGTSPPAPGNTAFPGAERRSAYGKGKAQTYFSKK